MKTRKIFLGSINPAATMSKGGITEYRRREYSIEELVEKLIDQSAYVPIENYINKEEVLDKLEELGLSIPRNGNNIYGIDAYCVYYKVAIDSKGSFIVRRYDYYPEEDVNVKNLLED